MKCQETLSQSGWRIKFSLTTGILFLSESNSLTANHFPALSKSSPGMKTFPLICELSRRQCSTVNLHIPSPFNITRGEQNFRYWTNANGPSLQFPLTSILKDRKMPPKDQISSNFDMQKTKLFLIFRLGPRSGVPYTFSIPSFQGSGSLMNHPSSSSSSSHGKAFLIHIQISQEFVWLLSPTPSFRNPSS